MHNYLNVTQPELNVESIKRHFDAIPKDLHFEDGDYRSRTASVLEYHDGKLTLLPNVPLYQSATYNTLENYGGKSRKYADIPAEMVDCPEFLKLVESWMDGLPVDVVKFSAHQIRTRAPGSPVPEGKHRDGYDWIGMYVARRQNIAQDTGVTSVWANESDETIFNGVLTEGTLISFDDSKVFHDTTPVNLSEQDVDAIRDVIIFSIPDHSFVME